MEVLENPVKFSNGLVNDSMNVIYTEPCGIFRGSSGSFVDEAEASLLLVLSKLQVGKSLDAATASIHLHRSFHVRLHRFHCFRGSFHR